MLSSFCKQSVYMIFQSFLNYFTNAIIVLVGDDMNRIMIYKKGDSLFANFYDEYEEKYHKLGNDDVLKLLNLIKESNKDITHVFYSGNNVNFTLQDVKISICDMEKLKKDKRFSFIFKMLKKKRYKITRNTIKIVSVIGLGVAIFSTGIVTINAINKIDFNDKLSTTVTTNYKDDDVLISKQQGILEEQNDSLKNKVVQSSESKTEVSLSTESSKTQKSEDYLIHSAIKEELNVGSLSESEKLKYVEENYSEIINKYSDMYGLDANLITAIATQERGKHSNRVDDGGAIGLMQIQVNVWNGEDITVYNYETGKEEKIHITLDKLKDVNFNIKVGCAIFQNYLKQMNGNLVAAIQSYNMGPTSVREIMTTYANERGKTYYDVLNNDEDIGWLDYRNSSYAGDPNYVENVSRYYNGDVQKLNVR